ncbi:MAG TPA: YfbM family protein [Candidatus Tumulicola sp.]
MNATFVEIDTVELARIQRDPSLAEALFQSESGTPESLAALSKVVQDRLKTVDPEVLAAKLEALDPRMKELLAGRKLFKLIEERQSRPSAERPPSPVLALDKAWHGVHYLLCGAAEPGPTLLSQAVLGGTVLGEDDEGFSGYGAPRYFTAPQVAELAAALNRPGLEAEFTARFDPEKMSALEIYPGWRSSDAQWLLDSLRHLRDFYTKAAVDGNAIVTCLV